MIETSLLELKTWDGRPIVVADEPTAEQVRAAEEHMGHSLNECEVLSTSEMEALLAMSQLWPTTYVIPAPSSPGRELHQAILRRKK